MTADRDLAKAAKRHKIAQTAIVDGVVILKATDMTKDQIAAHDLKVVERKANKTAEAEEVADDGETDGSESEAA